jgi:hypothetical protein
MTLLTRIVWTLSLIGMIAVLAAMATAIEVTPAVQSESSQQEAVDASGAAFGATTLEAQEKVLVPTSAARPWQVATEEILEK